MNFTEQELVALESGIQRIAVFFRLMVEPTPVRLWLGFGDIQPGINALDPQGETYVGFGAIGDIPSFKSLLNGKAERVDFSVSGVSGEILEIASGGDAKQVRGKPVSVGFALMAPDYSLFGAIRWVASYTADYLSIRQEVTDDPISPIGRTITLSCGSLMTARRRPSYSYFTNQDQTARYPGDLFCERTPVYANGFNKTWPTFPDS